MREFEAREYLSIAEESNTCASRGDDHDGGERIVLPSPPPCPNCERLWQTILWVGARMETLRKQTRSSYVKTNLHGLIRACDPFTNPRLRAALESARLMETTQSDPEEEVIP